MDRPWARIPRSLLSGAFFVLYGLFALPFAPLVPLLPRRTGRFLVRLFYRLFVFTARATGLFAVSVSGELRRPRGMVVAMNHVSLIDICVLLAHLPDSACIAKSSAKRNPFLSAVVSRLFISNDLGWEATVAEARKLLDSGVNVVVFPQGTRGGEEWRRGAARLALAAGTDVAAYRIAYDPVVLAKGQPWWDVGAKVICISLERLADIQSAGFANDRSGAVALTARIRDAILCKPSLRRLRGSCHSIV